MLRPNRFHCRALAITEASLGKMHPNTASAATSLAGLFNVMQRYAEALPLYERAMQIYEGLADGRPDADLALTLNGPTTILDLPLFLLLLINDPSSPQMLQFCILNSVIIQRPKSSISSRWTLTSAALATRIQYGKQTPIPHKGASP